MVSGSHPYGMVLSAAFREAGGSLAGVGTDLFPVDCSCAGRAGVTSAPCQAMCVTKEEIPPSWNAIAFQATNPLR